MRRKKRFHCHSITDLPNYNFKSNPSNTDITELELCGKLGRLTAVCFHSYHVLADNGPNA